MEAATAVEFATAKAGGERDDAPSPDHRAKGGEKGEAAATAADKPGAPGDDDDREQEAEEEGAASGASRTVRSLAI